MIKGKMLLLCSVFIFMAVTGVISEESGRFDNAIGFDSAGVVYNQYLLSYERRIIDHLSATFAAGGSPNAEFLSPSFRYSYIQTEIRGYPLSNSIEKLYTGFGVGMFFSDTLLDFSQWGLTQDKMGSTAVTTYGQIGWKFILPGKSGYRMFIDPNIFLYSISPLSLSAVKGSQAKPFVYKPFSAMCYLTIGIVF